MFQPLWAVLTSAAVGAGTWLYVAQASNRREAWDSEVYFTFAIPLIALTAAVISFVVPSRYWRWAMFPFGAQALVGILQNPTGSLLPIGLIMFGIFGALCVIPAAVGAAIGRKVAS